MLAELKMPPVVSPVNGWLTIANKHTASVVAGLPVNRFKNRAAWIRGDYNQQIADELESHLSKYAPQTVAAVLRNPDAIVRQIHGAIHRIEPDVSHVVSDEFLAMMQKGID